MSVERWGGTDIWWGKTMSVEMGAQTYGGGYSECREMGVQTYGGGDSECREVEP